MSLKLDLEKGKEAIKLSLEKKGIHTVPSADLAFVLDVSGSFHGTHVAGITQKLLERLVPWGMLFDPDQKLDVFTFSDGKNGAHHVGDITPETCGNYIKDKIIDRVPSYGNGTDYGYVLEKVLQNFGWLPESTGFLGRILGRMASTQTKRRSIVLFITDGDNSDMKFCRSVLEESEKRGDEVYFLFIGISHGSFPFLQEVADRFSNTGLVMIKDLKKFVLKTDEELNDELIGEELVTWLKK